MILFSEIFKRAVFLFDDPDIRHDYVMNPVGFQQEMRPLLINGLNKWTHPTEITDRLSVYSDPIGKSELIEGDGSATYTLGSTPVDNAVFSFKCGTEFLMGTYNKEDNTVTLSRTISTTETVIVSWYYAGAFEADFSSIFRADISSASIIEKTKNILAHALLSAWGDVEMNRALEMRNIFSDSDLGFYSPANSARAKTEWHNQINHDMDTLISELSWRIGATPRGGYNFGK